MGGLAETARELAYRLCTIGERKGWADEAQAYNGLVVNRPDLRKQAEEFTLR
jgi:putative DNA methylase